MARLGYLSFRQITSDFPLFKNHLFNKLYSYEYPNILFAKNVMNKIDFLKKISIEAYYNILFSMEKLQYDKYSYISRAYDYADSMIIVCDGVIEIRTECEGNEFIIENLNDGSILNH